MAGIVDPNSTESRDRKLSSKEKAGAIGLLTVAMFIVMGAAIFIETNNSKIYNIIQAVTAWPYFVIWFMLAVFIVAMLFGKKYVVKN